MSRPRLALASLAVLFLAAPWAAADWLVMEDGSKVETAGPWEVRGRMVVFELPNGTLASVRADEVDLEASEAATAEAARRAEEGADEAEEMPVTEAEPVLVLTDEDVSPARASPPPAKPEGGAGGRRGGQAAGADEGSERGGGGPPPVEVVSWEEVEGSTDGVEIFGRLQNQGEEIAAGLALTVSLLDDAGETLGTGKAFLGADSLAPEGSTSFRAIFPEVLNFRDVRFEVAGHTLSIRPADGGEEGGEGGGEEGGEGSAGGAEGSGES